MSEPPTDSDTGNGCPTPSSDDCSTSGKVRRLEPEKPSGGAKPIMPPRAADVRGRHKCIVEHRQEPFFITWAGSPDYPDPSKFPILENLDISSKTSSLSNWVQHESSILAGLASRRLPVVKVDQQPIIDNGVVCGYRMESLLRLDLTEFLARERDVRDVLVRLHAAGFCHGDVSPSNVMKDDDGQIVLIDFGFAGRIGDAVPPFIPRWVYSDMIFSADSDLKALDRFTR